MLEVEPRAGRIAIFSSGTENTHAVEKVTSGRRLTLSFWFTCDQEKEFGNFLDGKAHQSYGSTDETDGDKDGDSARDSDNREAAETGD